VKVDWKRSAKEWIDAVQHDIGFMVALHIVAEQQQISPCQLLVLGVLPVLVLRRASGHAVFTVASFLEMWKLPFENPPTLCGQTCTAGSIERVTGGAVALY
jgi:hypothetical protein